MTPKEKAKELVDKYLKNNPIQASVGLLKLQAKKCALVAVDEIISICPYQNYKKTITLCAINSRGKLFPAPLTLKRSGTKKPSRGKVREAQQYW